MNKLLIKLSNLTLVLIFTGVIALPMLLNIIPQQSSEAILGDSGNNKPISFSVKNTSWDKIFHDFEGYFTSSFKNKEVIIKLNSLLRYMAFKTSSTPAVVVGKDGWLFSAIGQKSDPIADYRGTNLFSEEQLAKIQKNITEKSNWLKSKGIQFTIVIIPSTFHIYPEKLPNNIIPFSNENRLDQVSKVLKNCNEVNFVDLKDSLVKNKSKGLLYNKTSSGWNDLGAFYGYSCLMSNLSISTPNLTILSLNDFETKSAKVRGGELAEKIGIADFINQDSIQLIKKSKSMVKIEKKDNENITISEIEGSNLPRAIVIGDTYLDAQIPFFSESFSRGVFIKDNKIDNEILNQNNPDSVIYEISVDNLEALLSDDFNKDNTNGISNTSVTLSIQPELPVITSKTLLNPTEGVVVGEATNCSEVYINNGADKISQTVVNGKFTLSVPLKLNGSNYFSLYGVGKNGKTTDPVSFSFNVDSSAPTKPVMIGKAGRLVSKETVADYCGDNILSLQQLEQIRLNLEEKQNWLKSNGKNIQFMVMFAPNPLTIYPEDAPGNLIKSSQDSPLNQVINYLKANSDIQVADVRNILLSKKTMGNLYYKTDSHWNELGAYFGYYSLATKLEQAFPAIKPIELSKYNLLPSKDVGGDLVYYLGLNKSAIEEETIHLKPKFDTLSNFTPSAPFVWVGNCNNTFTTHVNDENLPKAVMFRDSYATNLMPFLSENFRELVYYEEWNYKLDKDLIDSEKPDIVIYELVEKNISELLKN